MVQTTFSVGNSITLATALAQISSGGTDAAAATAYTITLTTAISAASASVDLDPGSGVTLDGPYALIIDGFAAIGAITTDLDFTGTITLDNGALNNVALVTNSGGTTIAGLYTGAVLGTSGDAGDSAVNDGTITYGGAFAAVEFDLGTVQNGWDGTTAALISGAAGGVQFNISGLVQNGGTILSTGTDTAAVFLGAGTVDNGNTGDTTAQISGVENGVEITGAGLVANAGTIVGVASNAVYLGSGTVVNGGTDNFTALIDGGPADNGVWVGAGSGSVDNFATITGGGAAGVYLQHGGMLTNGASGDTRALVSGYYEGVLLAAAGSVDNAGTIQAIGSDAIQDVIGAFLENGGTVENLAPASRIDGVDWGVVVEGSNGWLQNLGSIEASGTQGLGADLTAGGTVENGLTAGSAALIMGAYDGVRISAGAPGAGAEVQNDGTIEGSVGVDFQSGATPAAGTLTNDGLIQSTAGASGHAVVFGAGAELLVLQSGGAFIGDVLGSNVTGSTTSLELAATTQGTLSALAGDAGTATDSAGAFAFSEIGTITVDAGASWTLAAGDTLHTLANAGSLALSGGTVTVTGTVTNSGGITIDPGTLTLESALVSAGATTGRVSIEAGSTMTLEAGADSGQNLQFTPAGTAETLALAAPLDVQAAIDHFGVGRTIDLLNTTVTGLQYTGDTLNVFNGTATVATLDLTGSYITGSFSHVPDTSGTGTFITTSIPCFAAGTRIRTCAGEVAVEALRVGDRLPTHFADAAREIIWIGYRRVDCRRHRSPHKVWPVRIAAHALGPNQPHRDLLLSPDHAVLVGKVLIPVKRLVNDRSIKQIATEAITYYHIELAQHDVVWADGLQVETYLETGGRTQFANGGSVTALHANFFGLWEALGCAPLIVTGPQLAAARALLDARAEAGQRDRVRA